MTVISKSPAPAPLAPHPLLTDYYAADPASRRLRVGQMFNASAPHYDWINSVLSFGSGRWYRRDALRRLGVGPGARLVDVGSGTGVIALVAQELVGDSGEVTAVDPSEGMLAVARASGVRNIVPGRAESLPFPDAHFDFLTMGYALRHVEDLGQTFAEYRRVLKPGGKLLLLEITRPRGNVANAVLRFYMRSFIPGVTGLLRRSPEAQTLMRYYWDTIEQCVPPEAILSALAGAGLAQVERGVSFGIFSEYTATRPR
jgi:demethylmenaquinone methyltransferase/2-methoxy-6-polyprenyl-1,4-benzoquinol methylase